MKNTENNTQKVNQHNIRAQREIEAYNRSVPGRKMLQAANSLLTIRLYRHDGLWVFDDDRVGLKAEPFVAGADDLIDYLLDIKGMYATAIREGVTAIFGKQEFRGADVRLDFTVYASGGTVYEPYGLPDFRNKTGSREVWLCPALNLYFPESPQRIWVSMR